MRYLGYLMIATALAVPMLAAGADPVVPEINAGSASAAIALLSGGLLVLKARKR